MATEHKPLIGKVLSLKNHLQRVSTFHRDSVIKGNVGDDVLYKAFMSVYWIAKQEIPKCKPVPLLQLLGKADVTEMKHFTHKSAGCVREHFLTLGQVIIEQLLEKVHRSIFFLVFCVMMSLILQHLSSLSALSSLLTRFWRGLQGLSLCWECFGQQQVSRYPDLVYYSDLKVARIEDINREMLHSCSWWRKCDAGSLIWTCC